VSSNTAATTADSGYVTGRISDITVSYKKQT